MRKFREFRRKGISGVIDVSERLFVIDQGKAVTRHLLRAGILGMFDTHTFTVRFRRA